MHDVYVTFPVAEDQGVAWGLAFDQLAERIALHLLLGAGIATVLSLHLRATFPNLRVWGIEPPGGLLSAELAEACGANAHVESLNLRGNEIGPAGCTKIADVLARVESGGDRFAPILTLEQDLPSLG